ncbi:MAG TPA: hypothetical protein GXX39_08490 [Syntrophothermus lipocalidus]|uniref:Uncharacterized protein n=1 Tax=Syntrophothermus lipocalidus (strain DSM 12680 / TGB-C1) TaxID=643648 RepID=D7CKV4_SYNLT|nr:hypothetical protein [Syntrophothermus lipocalidus]ADI01339.1 hypothetical protein Slip_0555 [Syntrophothermus lipocalidus DSM 12680]HHV77391.1 hypothetical protein [Syntrophothermus lipocalidus]HOV43581.1 hypothetical protein [Syntrophothermus lipocalidus]
MSWFSRPQEMLRADLIIGGEHQCSLKLEPSGEGRAMDQMKLIRMFYVTFLARLLHDAGEGPMAERILTSARILFNGLIENNQTAGREETGKDLWEYDRLAIVDHLSMPAEKHRVTLVRQRDNSVVCRVRSYSRSKDLLLKKGPLMVVKYADKSLGPRVYKDLSDALHRMCRFYQDTPYWKKEGLLAVPCMTLGILRK